MGLKMELQQTAFELSQASISLDAYARKKSWILQGDPSGQWLHLVDFDLVVTMPALYSPAVFCRCAVYLPNRPNYTTYWLIDWLPALFCLGSCKSGRNGMACRQWWNSQIEVNKIYPLAWRPKQQKQIFTSDYDMIGSKYAIIIANNHNIWEVNRNKMTLFPTDRRRYDPPPGAYQPKTFTISNKSQHLVWCFAKEVLSARRRWRDTAGWARISWGRSRTRPCPETRRGSSSAHSSSSST